MVDSNLKGRKTNIFLSVALISSLSLVIPMVMALESKPDIYITPPGIPINGVVDIHIRAYDPPGDDPNVPNDFLYILVHSVVVRYPAGSYTEEYMLGTAFGPGISGQKIRIDYGEDIALPYGYMVGKITIDGNDYYWWRTRKNGGPVSPNERIDIVVNPSPTGWVGQYEADVEGVAYYGSNEQDIRLGAYFNIPVEFPVPEFGLTTAAISLLAYWVVSLRKRKLPN